MVSALNINVPCGHSSSPCAIPRMKLRSNTLGKEADQEQVRETGRRSDDVW